MLHRRRAGRLQADQLSVSLWAPRSLTRGPHPRWAPALLTPSARPVSALGPPCANRQLWPSDQPCSQLAGLIERCHCLRQMGRSPESLLTCPGLACSPALRRVHRLSGRSRRGRVCSGCLGRAPALRPPECRAKDDQWSAWRTWGRSSLNLCPQREAWLCLCPTVP